MNEEGDGLRKIINIVLGVCIFILFAGMCVAPSIDRKIVCLVFIAWAGILILIANKLIDSIENKS